MKGMKKWLFLAMLTALTLDGSGALGEARWTDTAAPGRVEAVCASHQAACAEIKLEKNESASFIVRIPAQGEYQVILDYVLPLHMTGDSAVTVTLDGKTAAAAVNDLWMDTEEYQLDRFGNEFIARQEALSAPHEDYLRSFSAIDVSPLCFSLSAGEHCLTLRADTQPVMIRHVYVAPIQTIPDYGGYRASESALDAGGDAVIAIEAEKYTYKSHAYLSPANVQDMTLSPYDVYHKRLNVIGTVSEGSGYRLVWTFTVEQAGWYGFGMRYAQDTLQDVPAFFDLELDGRTLFEEMRGVGAPYTKGDYRNFVFADAQGAPYRMYLSAGEHTVSVLFNGEKKQRLTDEIHAVMMDMNRVGVEIKKIVGISDDVNRVWKMEQYMPDLDARMDGWRAQLDACYADLAALCDAQAPGGAVDLRIASSMIASLQRDIKHLPGRLSELSEGSGSAAQLLGALLPKLYDQVFAIDRLFFFQNAMPESQAGLLARAANGVKGFCYSFTDEGKRNGAIAGDTQELEFWVAGSVAYVETLQRMVDAYFTPETGISVRLSVLADSNKVLLAVAANEAPDGVLGIASHLPFQLAMRGALVDLSSQEGFKQFVKENFNPNVLQPYVFEDKIYALCERQDFYVMFYRRDLMEQLGLELPNTWEDVERIMPALRRQGMSFYVPLSSASGLKPFYATLPFIFQTGGKLYSADGMRAVIGSDEAVRGFRLMCDLYNLYSFDKQTVNFYNSFRYGLTPLGVSSLNDYILMTTGAPEISGLWDIALSPGVADAEGNVNRAYTAATHADVILKGADVEKAWRFLQWWMSTETQTTYAQMMLNQYGPAYLWNSANKNAFAQLGIDNGHRAVILASWEQIQEAPSHPATYMMERELSNAWIDTVVNGEFYRSALDDAILHIDRDILRKLEEFGYYADGKKLRDFVISDVSDLLGF